MPISSLQILTVGPATLQTLRALRRLARCGWTSHSVAGVRESETVLKRIRFKVVLSAERLADGMGYELAPIIGRQTGTLYIGVALSEAWLWLPVVELSVRSIGNRVVNSMMLESEVAEVLDAIQNAAGEAAGGAVSEQLRPLSRVAPRVGIPPRRKGLECGAAGMKRLKTIGPNDTSPDPPAKAGAGKRCR